VHFAFYFSTDCFCLNHGIFSYSPLILMLRVQGLRQRTAALHGQNGIHPICAKGGEGGSQQKNRFIETPKLT